MKNQISALAVLACVGGCSNINAAFNDITPTAPAKSVACPADNGVTPLHALCQTLREVNADAAKYAENFSLNAGNKMWVHGLALAAAIAGSGFVVFDAHADNIKGAGLAAGAFLLLDSNLKFDQRMDINRAAVMSLTCYIGNGNTIAEGMVAGGDQSKIESAKTTLAGAIAYAKIHVATTPAAGAAERESLISAIDVAEAAQLELIKASRAFSRANALIRTDYLQAEHTISTRLVGLRVNLADLIKQAQEIAKSLETPKPETGEGDPAPTKAKALAMMINPPATPDDKSVTAVLKAAVGAASLVESEKYVGAFTALGACKALAAG